MSNKIFLFLALYLALFSCTSDPVQSEVESVLEEWFPGQYQVIDGHTSIQGDSLALVLLQAKADPQLQFTIPFDTKKEKGALQKDSIQSAIAAAKVNAKPARELFEQLGKNGLKNVVVGTDLNAHALTIQLYEDPFNSIFGSRIKQIQKIAAEWGAKRQMVPCRLTLLVMEPKSWGQKFSEVMDARYVNRPDAWVAQNEIANARADLADPGSIEFLPGSLQLSGNRELEIRKKVHAEVTDFLRTSQKLDFHVEMFAMVNSEWDLRTMDQIRYFFPYCQETESSKSNGGCMGNFDGRISCVYNFKTGEMQVDF